MNKQAIITSLITLVWVAGLAQTKVTGHVVSNGAMTWNCKRLPSVFLRQTGNSRQNIFLINGRLCRLLGMSSEGRLLIWGQNDTELVLLFTGTKEYETLQTLRLDDGDSHSRHDSDCLQS